MNAAGFFGTSWPRRQGTDRSGTHGFEARLAYETVAAFRRFSPGNRGRGPGRNGRRCRSPCNFRRRDASPPGDTWRRGSAQGIGRERVRWFPRRNPTPAVAAGRRHPRLRMPFARRSATGSRPRRLTLPVPLLCHVDADPRTPAAPEPGRGGAGRRQLLGCRRRPGAAQPAPLQRVAAALPGGRAAALPGGRRPPRGGGRQRGPVLPAAEQVQAFLARRLAQPGPDLPAGAGGAAPPVAG
jgi:hypothetical protein